jgi:DNA repair protein SbcC/Rad50
MRPLKLELEAIGPFLNGTAIDFSQIRENDLFLIHGATGRGKTFIFDAICYALYGQTPSGREGHLKSDFAPCGVCPWVRFTFSLKSTTYEVYRSLAYERDKVRGEGTTEEKETQTLTQLAGTEGDAAKTLATKKSEVNTRLSGLLGLDRMQFQQVVMLPQGEFRQLLLASSVDRERLLERLFDASDYERIQRWIEEQVHAKRLAARDLETRIDVLGTQARPLIPESIRPADGVGLTQEHIQEGVGALGLRHQEESETAQGLEECAAKAAKQLAQATQIEEDFSERDKLTDTLAELGKAEEGLKALRKESGLALNAEELRQPRTDRDRTKQALLVARKANEEAGKELEAAKVLAAAAVKKAEGVPALEDQAKALRARSAKLGPLVQLAAGRQSNRDAMAEAHWTLRRAKREHDSADGQVRAVQTSIAQEEAKAETLRQKATDPGPLEARKTQLGEYARLVSETRRKGTAFQRQQGAAAKAEKLLATAQEGLAELRQRREANLAGELAEGLEESKPCPVCGSTHHPVPAQPVNTEATRGAIAAADTEVAKARTKAGTMRDKATEAKAGWQQTSDALEKQKALLPDIVPERIGDELERVKKCLVAEAERRKSETACVARLAALRATDSPKAEAACGMAREAHEEAKLSLATLWAKVDEAQTSWQRAMDAETEALFGQRRVSGEDVQNAMTTLTGEAEKLEHGANALRKAVQAAYSKAATAGTLVTERQKREKTASGEAEAPSNAFAQILEASCFPDEATLVVALRNDEWRLAAKKRIDTHDQNKRDAAVKLAQANKRLEGKEPPEVEALKEAEAKAKAEHKAAADASAGTLTRLPRPQNADSWAAACYGFSGTTFSRIGRFCRFVA